MANRLKAAEPKIRAGLNGVRVFRNTGRHVDMPKSAWVMADDQHDGVATAHSGGEHRQLNEDFDSRDRKIASDSGGTVTPEILSRPGAHVPKEKGWKETPADFADVLPYSNSPDPANYPKDGKVAAAFREVYAKVPRSVKRTGKKGAAKRKMMTAIALSKARAAGEDIPEPKE